VGDGRRRALFIAVKETYEVVEIYEWPGWLFAALLVLMLVLCAANTVLRVRRAHDLVEARSSSTGDADPEAA